MKPIFADTKWPTLAQYCLVGCVALTAIAASVLIVPGLAGVLGAGLGVVMLAIAVIDVRRFVIPNALTSTALGLALVSAGVQEQWDGVLTALLRGAVAALSFLAARAIYRWLRQREGIGLGDVKLAGVAGVWLTWTMVPVAIEIAALAALAGYLLRWLAGGPLQRQTRVPFGLFFAPAIWVCWLLDARRALDLTTYVLPAS